MIWNYKITCYTMILYWGSTKNLCAVTIENEITLQVWKTCHVETWHFTWWHVQVECVDILVAFCSNILLTPNLLAHIFTSNGYALWSAFVTRSHRAQESELAGLTSLHGGTLPCFFQTTHCVFSPMSTAVTFVTYITQRRICPSLFTDFQCSALYHPEFIVRNDEIQWLPRTWVCRAFQRSILPDGSGAANCPIELGFITPQKQI